MASNTSHAIAAPWTIALASYCNMFCVGGSYALTALQFELPRLLDLPVQWSFAPFAAVCIGLSLGLGSCAFSLSRLGARSTVANGTLIWGLGLVSVGRSLAVSSFVRLLLFALLGGVGVGWTYLAVILMVGQAFPSQPFARSAIGPLGFSSGAGLCFALRAYLDFGSMSENDLGQMIQIGGSVCLVTGIMTLLGLPNDHQPGMAPSQNMKPNKLPGRISFSLLLFFNALPGMTVLAGLLPLAQAHSYSAANSLVFNMAALALGGLLAQPLSTTLGPKTTFALLFATRGLLLLRYACAPGVTGATLVLSAILFSHGAGFGILPGLVKRQQPEPSAFSASYGQVLIVWGLAGVVGTSLCSFFISAPGGEATLSSIVGVMALLCSGILQVLPVNDHFEQ